MDNKLSPQTIMYQVRRQLAVELLDRAEKTPARSAELYDFLAGEPVSLSPEIFNRMADLGQTSFVMGHFRSPFILSENPKPILRSFSLKGCVLYVRQYAKFVFMKIFLKALRKTLVFHEELKTMQFFSGKI